MILFGNAILKATSLLLCRFLSKAVAISGQEVQGSKVVEAIDKEGI